MHKSFSFCLAFKTWLYNKVSAYFFSHLFTLFHQIDTIHRSFMAQSVRRIITLGREGCFIRGTLHRTWWCAQDRHNGLVRIIHAHDIRGALDCGNIHGARMDFTLRLVCMEHDTQLSLLVCEERMVSCAVQTIPPVQERTITAHLGPACLGYIGGQGIAHGIVLASTGVI